MNIPVRSPTGLRLHLLAMVALVSCAALHSAEVRSAIPPINEDSAQEANYKCATVKGDGARAAAQLSERTYSKNDLACAADLRAAIAEGAPHDLTTQVAALQSVVAYLDHIRTLHAFDLGHINTGEFDARIARARTRVTGLVQRARGSWPDDPQVMALTAIIDLYTEDGAHHLDVVRATQKSLERAVALDPKVLGGLPYMVLGQLNLELPPLLGGDTNKALGYFNAALDAAPGNVRALNSVAECNLQMGKTADAVAVLRKVAGLAPQSEADRQLFVDEWRTGEGLATRAGDEALASKMGGLRNALLKSHPELLPRNSSIVLGHGGSNPVTGSQQYKGDHTQPSAAGAEPKH